jgi:single-strand DNA-binding protein
VANFNLNKVMLGGRLTADPELKQTQNGTQVASFSIAVNRRFRSGDNQQTATDFFNVTAWRALAEHVARYYRKGSSIFVVGSIQNRTWTDQQGVKRYATDIVADELYFVDSRSESPMQAAQPYTPDAYNAAPAYSTPVGAAPNFEEIKTDDDLPF